MEKVLCIKKDRLPNEWLKEEIAIKYNESDIETFIKNSDILWIDKDKAENDINYKQIIPYAIVQNSNNEFACYLRHGSEDRLHGCWSLGIGGHINPQDGLSDIISIAGAALTREMQEEFLDFDFGNSSLAFKGIINEEYSEVGNSHIGFVYFVSTDVTPLPDEELKNLTWIKNDQINNFNLELWSKLAFSIAAI